jgi:hypothetical protein
MLGITALVMVHSCVLINAGGEKLGWSLGIGEKGRRAMESSVRRLWTSTLPRGGIAMLGGGFWDQANGDKASRQEK